MSERILMTGVTSSIGRELRNLLPETIELMSLSRPECDLSDLAAIDRHTDKIQLADKLVLAHGAHSASHFLERSPSEIDVSMRINLLSFVRVIEISLQSNPNARIVVIGSESGDKGSHDITYGLAKAALHRYVRERRISYPGQQLVAIAPSTLVDGGMTLRRSNRLLVEKALTSHPKKRGLYSKEVARMIHHLLFVDKGYTSNTVIEMNGGKFSRS